MADERGPIEIHLRELSQLFHSLDPSPFNDRSLDTEAEEFIVGSAKELSHDVALTLVIYLQQQAGQPDKSRLVGDAVREHFKRRAEQSRRDLRQLFWRGRTSLAIGLPILATSIVVGELIAPPMEVQPLSGVLRESLLIGGWVAMWRPMEIFLYDWWPIRDEERLYKRLASMSVQVLPANP